jgi:uncharacterized protein YfdQ (DUF2303 family)
MGNAVARLVVHQTLQSSDQPPLMLFYLATLSLNKTAPYSGLLDDDRTLVDRGTLGSTSHSWAFQCASAVLRVARMKTVHRRTALLQLF